MHTATARKGSRTAMAARLFAKWVRRFCQDALKRVDGDRSVADSVVADLDRMLDWLTRAMEDDDSVAVGETVSELLREAQWCAHTTARIVYGAKSPAEGEETPASELLGFVDDTARRIAAAAA